MAKPLDGVALPAYFRRLGYERATQDLLIHIRNSPPSRTPGARRGNMPVWYPSKKMQCIIKAESAKVEFAFLLQAEHDDEVLEVWDQPPSIPLEYEDHRRRVQRPMHTPDYFLFRASGAKANLGTIYNFGNVMRRRRTTPHESSSIQKILVAKVKIGARTKFIVTQF